MKEPINIQELQQRIALYEDMKAYQTLYNSFFPGLCRFSYAIVKSKESAEEIVSDTFIKLWQIRSKLTEIENLKVYLYTITRNFSLNYIAKHYKNPVVSLDAIDIEAVVTFNGPEEMCISADIIKQVQEVIRSLPPQCRIIFQLVKEEGLQYKEVADILNISVLTVRNQVAIATRKISEALPAYLLPPAIFNNRFSRS